MSLQLNVERDQLQVCINAPNDSIKDILPQLKILKVFDRYLHIATLSYGDFLQFIQSPALQRIQTIVKLKKDVSVSGFGASDEKSFEEFGFLLKKYSDLNLVKKRAVISSLNTLDFAIQNKLPWFFKFGNLLPVTELINVHKGVQIQREDSQRVPNYPFLYVHVNKGVSFYKVVSPVQFQKLSGSVIGDSTVEGLLKILGVQKDLNSAFDEAFEHGFSINVDLTVGDIYGENVDFQLPRDLIASTMGKSQFKSQKDIKTIDVVKSLWNMLAINLGMLSALIAQTENLSTIVCHSSKITYDPFLYTLQILMNTFGEGKIDIFFVEHGEYISIFGLE